MSKATTTILQIVAVPLIWWYGKYHAPDDLRPELQGFAFGMAVMLFIQAISWTVVHRNLLLLYWDSLNVFVRPEIRVSMAYLYRIEFQGKFLLVKNNRFSVPTYQPVGGVYKYFHPDANPEFRSFGATTDINVPSDTISEFDLRIRLKHRFRLPRFLKWFLSEKQREIDPWREFYEELIRPGILPAHNFCHLFYEKIAQHYERIHWDRHFNIYTFKFVDIYFPRFTSTVQENIIRGLLHQPSDLYIWATEGEIKNRISSDGRRIADHTHKIFETKTI